MKKIMLLLCFVSTIGFSQKESDFYKETNHLVSKTVDLVKDYKAKSNDGKDDSSKLQRAIDDMSKKKNGGRVIIPKGIFHLNKILMKSNVHIEINSKATLVTSGKSGVMFFFGAPKGNESIKTIENVSIRSNDGKKYKVDFRHIKRTDKMAFAILKNTKNFLIADFEVLDNYSVLSSIILNVSDYENKFFRPENGLIKNGHAIRGNFGYGLIQAQAGLNVLFKDLSAIGGITLRMETGADNLLRVPKSYNLDNIYGRNISILNGHGAVMMGAHSRSNGHVDVDGVYAESSLIGVSMGSGFITKEEKKEGHSPGGFAATSIVKNVHAVYGTKAQLKPKNVKEIPCELRGEIEREFSPDGISYYGPASIAARNFNPGVKFINITQEGFEFQKETVLVHEIKKDNCPEKLILKRAPTDKQRFRNKNKKKKH